MAADKKAALQVLAQILRRPNLWLVAFRQLWRIRRSGWYRRLPFLPIPEASYLQFRIHTAYGNERGNTNIAKDVTTYLQWCKSWPAASK